MRISDLARESGVSIPTIKFYLREGLVPPGRRTAPNQATYGPEHLRRLRLVRALAEIGGLSLASVRDVLDAVDRADTPLHDVLAAAHTALRRDEMPGRGAHAEARAEVDAWMHRLGWQVTLDAPALDDLGATLAVLRELGWDVGPDVFTRYAEHADAVAEAEIAFVADLEDRASAVEVTVVGTVLFERAFSALRRLAHERHSRARLRGPRPT